MTVCVESYIGAEDGLEGVKLEEQVLITEEGCRPGALDLPPTRTHRSAKPRILAEACRIC